jgi:hypothetical protein
LCHKLFCGPFSLDSRERAGNEQKNLSVIFTVLTALPLLCTTIFAEDIYPPPWRGEPGTTYSLWEFLSDDPNPTPDEQSNLYGDPATTIYPGFSQEWQEELGGHIGVWPLSGVVYITIPNSDESNPYKDIRVQVTWAAQVPGPGGKPYISEELTGETGTLIEETMLDATNEQPAPPLARLD